MYITLLIIIGLLLLMMGLMLGFYARTMYDRLSGLYELYKENKETPAGIVRPVITRGNVRAQLEEIDLTADEEDAGITMRPSPDQIRLQNMKERERRVRDL